MSPSKKRKLLKKQIAEDIQHLDRSMASLRYSYEKCTEIGLEPDRFSLDEQESFEALTGRFARTSDLLTQKVVKTLFRLLQENVITFIDGANLLEKLEIIRHADDMLNIRELRNQIAHEYVEKNLKDLFKDVLIHTPILDKIIQSVKEYTKRDW